MHERVSSFDTFRVGIDLERKSSPELMSIGHPLTTTIMLPLNNKIMKLIKGIK